MTSPLDEKGLRPNQFEFKGAIYEVGPMEYHRYFGNRRPITTIKKADTNLSATAAESLPCKCGGNGIEFHAGRGHAGIDGQGLAGLDNAGVGFGWGHGGTVS